MKRILLSMLVAVIAPVASGCSKAAEPTPQMAIHVAPGAVALVPDRSLVCMVNDRFMGRPQIPVEVGGRTYFGCCEGCKTRLAQEPAVRMAVDPVSGRSVDKAQAVLAVDDKGAVLYFESDESFGAYAQRSANGTN